VNALIKRFADRGFYDDWWNSETYDEFARKWNKPVHEFLMRHVYLESISSHKWSKQNATILTFVLSSLIHELVFVVIVKRVSLYMMAFQMLQLPLIYLGRAVKVKNYPWVGNAIFWIGMYIVNFSILNLGTGINYVSVCTRFNRIEILV
jgi:sterol O-acyltransferase